MLVSEPSKKNLRKSQGKNLKLIHAKKNKMFSGAKCTSKPYSKAHRLKGTPGPKGQAFYRTHMLLWKDRYSFSPLGQILHNSWIYPILKSM